MQTTWKLTIKPNGDKSTDAFKLCKEKGLLGVGWSLFYEKEIPKDLEDAKKIVGGLNHKWPSPVKYLMEDMKPGDHVWIHQGGLYHLCKADSDLLFGQAIDDKLKDKTIYDEYDLGHARRAEWVEVPEKYVSGKIQRGTIAQRMIQRIIVTESEFEYHSYLFDKLSNDQNWKPVIDNIELKNRIYEINANDFFGIITPDDAEDIVAAYLQSLNWVLIKSTCFRSKSKFEFSMINKKKETCLVQVKTGDIRLNPESYRQDAAKNANTKIYLFSFNTELYGKPPVPGVIPIEHDKIMDFVKKNVWALTPALRLRLWLTLAKKEGNDRRL